MNDIHTRTKFLVDTLGPNPNAFAVKTRVNIQTLRFIIYKDKRGSKPNFDFICKVFTTFPQINLRWYLFGEGIWNINNQKLSRKENNKFHMELNNMQRDLDKYKKLYAEERFVNDALREKIRKSIK